MSYLFCIDKFFLWSWSIWLFTSIDDYLQSALIVLGTAIENSGKQIDSRLIRSKECFGLIEFERAE